jgi:hypothetical protein
MRMSELARIQFVVSPELPMLPYLVDLESPFDAATPRDYDPIGTDPIRTQRERLLDRSWHSLA